MYSKGTKELLLLFLRYLLSVTAQTSFSALLVGACFLVVSLGCFGFHLFYVYTLYFFFFFSSQISKKYSLSRQCFCTEANRTSARSKLLKIAKYINTAFPTVKLFNGVYVGSQLWNCEQLWCLTA